MAKLHDWPKWQQCRHQGEYCRNWSDEDLFYRDRAICRPCLEDLGGPDDGS